MDIFEDLKKFHASFWRDFDFRMAWNFWEKLSLKEPCEALGEGSHGMAWPLGHSMTFWLAKKPLPASWSSAIKSLNQKYTPGIGPMALLESPSKGKALVQPLGKDGPWNKEWEDFFISNDMRLLLFERGLLLEDTLQWKTWSGIPFLVDFSDLRFI